jgi:cell division protein FtsX
MNISEFIKLRKQNDRVKIALIFITISLISLCTCGYHTYKLLSYISTDAYYDVACYDAKNIEEVKQLYEISGVTCINEVSDETSNDELSNNYSDYSSDTVPSDIYTNLYRITTNRKDYDGSMQKKYNNMGFYITDSEVLASEQQTIDIFLMKIKYEMIITLCCIISGIYILANHRHL